MDSSAGGPPLGRALLGHYDLSGALFAYDRIPGLASTAAKAGITGADWRIGLGRWEAATLLLPSLTDGTPCPDVPAAAAPGATDLDLIAARDWFTDDGGPVTLADTADASRYALAYARRALDTALAFGAKPFLSVDLMPRALAANRTPERDDCLWTFRNRVSNARPADPAVFAAALVGALERLRLGGDGEAGRPFTHVELWNEPELPLFWERAFEDGPGELDRFFETAITALVALDAWRAASPRPEIQAMRFGLAGFASAETAARVLERFEATPLPGGRRVPLDFVSFHAYADDPRAIGRAIERVRSARDRARHYRSAELVLSEWGPDLEAHASDPAWAASIEPALHAAQVVAAAARAGVGRTHRALLWDFHPGGVLTLGLAAHDAAPRPLARAYELLAHTIGEGTTLARARILAAPASGAALVTRSSSGRLHALFVNPSPFAGRAELRIDGETRGPRKAYVFDDPAGGVRRVDAEPTLVLGPRSLLVADY